MAIKSYYCVMDKHYTNIKKGEVAQRFISIRVKEHASQPKDSIERFEHADIRYTWFKDADEAREYKSKLQQEDIVYETI